MSGIRVEDVGYRLIINTALIAIQIVCICR